MLMFDVGANRGDATFAGLNKGYKVVAIEPAPKVYKELVKNFIYEPRVVPLRFAVSDSYGENVKFYECVEDGLSTLEESWLTDSSMPYKGKEYRTISATTITIDALVCIYGEPDLIKIDVEGGEWSVFRGMTQKYGVVTFEWTDATIKEHSEQLNYLKSIGYSEVGPQYIEHHLQEPEKWYKIEDFSIDDWIKTTAKKWSDGGWKKSNLRATTDVGMLWVK